MASEAPVQEVIYEETNWTRVDNSTKGTCSVAASSAREGIKELRSVGWGIAILVTMTVLSFATICMFLHTFVRIRKRIPYGNRRIFLVRLFGLFPVFSGTSLAGFYIPKASLIANWGASLYLSSTLYTFVLLIVDYYGGVELMEEHIKDLKTAYIRPLCVFLGAILWADGIYKPSIIEADSAFVYLTVISLVSSLVAVYGLSVIYNATHTQLQHFMIASKFATVKCVLIMTNAQNLLIAVLIANDVIPCVGPFASAVRGELLYNMLVVLEMFIMTVCFKLYYWRWMVKHEYGQEFARSSVGDVKVVGEDACMKEPIDDLPEKTSINGSLSNISKTGSFKSETVV